MVATYIDAQVTRVNRNLMLVNGGVLGLMAVFLAFMQIGSAMVARFQERNQADVTTQSSDALAIYHQPAALDIAHPVRLRSVDIASAGQMEDLSGHAVTYSDPQAQNLRFPVWEWMTRATGKNKPHLPPMYHVSMVNGRPLVILPAVPSPGTTFTGVIRPFPKADLNAVKPVLMGHGFQEPQPFILDCLNLEGSPVQKIKPLQMRPPWHGWRGTTTSQLVFSLIIGLSGWNVFKAAQRMKNPLTHPIYAKLGRYGSPLEICRIIDAERQAGVTVVAPVEFTRSWLIFPSLWTLDAVPLDQIAWAYKMITLYNFIPLSFRMVVVDREGKYHPISADSAKITRLLEYIGQIQPWVLLGYSRQLNNRFWRDRSAVLAEIDARRTQTVR